MPPQRMLLSLLTCEEATAENLNLPLLFHVGEKRVRNGQVRMTPTGVVLPIIILQATLLFPTSFGIAVQLSSSLISPCPVPKVYGIFNNRVLSPSSGGHTMTMVMACITWGRKVNLLHQDHILDNTGLPGEG